MVSETIPCSYIAANGHHNVDKRRDDDEISAPLVYAQTRACEMALLEKCREGGIDTAGL